MSKLLSSLDNDQYQEIKKNYRDLEQFKCIRQKGIFPYTYIDGFFKIKETKLPSKDNFFNDLTNEHITEGEYDRAKHLWQLFKCNNLSDYSDVYL